MGEYVGWAYCHDAEATISDKLLPLEVSFDYPFDADKSFGIIWVVGSVDGDAGSTGGVNKGNFSGDRVAINYDADVANGSGAGIAAFEEDEVAGLYLHSVDFIAVIAKLFARGALQVVAELGEDVGCKSGAVEAFWSTAAIAIVKAEEGTGER